MRVQTKYQTAFCHLGRLSFELFVKGGVNGKLTASLMLNK